MRPGLEWRGAGPLTQCEFQRKSHEQLHGRCVPWDELTRRWDAMFREWSVGPDWVKRLGL